MNILKIQDDLKNFSQQQLVTEMQRPSGNVPQFLVLSELSRRKRMQTDQARAEAANTPTVAQEAVAAAGMPTGNVTQMAQAMAPKTSMAENTGIATMMPKQPTRMAEGGVVKMQTAGLAGGTVSAIAHLKVNYPKLYEAYKDDPEELALIAAEKFEKDMEVAKDPELTGLEQFETPRTNFQKFMDFARYSPLKGRKNMEKIEEGAKERDTQARVDTANALRRRNQFYVGQDPIFNDLGVDKVSEQLKGTVVPVPLAEDPLKFRPSDTFNPSVAPFRPPNTLDAAMDLSMSPPSTFGDDPYVGNRAIPESLRLSTSFLKPNVPQAPDQSGIQADMAQDQLRKFIATEDPKFYGPEAKAMGQRARKFYNTDTYIPPEMAYSFDVRDILKREEASPEEIQAASDRLYNEAIEGEEAKVKQQFGDLDAEAQAAMDEAIAAQAAMVKKEGEPKTLFDRMASFIPTDLEAAEYVESMFDKGTTKIADMINDFQSRDTVKEKTSDLDKQRQEAAAEQADEILKSLQGVGHEKAMAAANKADLSLSEYIKGLDKDRESSKWLAVARMGAELMKPSATIGEGIGKAVSVGAKDLQEGKKAYNKSKLTVLGLQARIDAAKAKSGALTTDQRLRRGLDFQEEARKLEEAARMTNPVDLDLLENARVFKLMSKQLLGMPSMASSSVVKAPSAT